MATAVSQPGSHRAGISDRLEAAAALFTGLAAVAIVFSIAASEILIGAALLLLLLSRQAISFPSRLGLPLLAFMGWTLLSLAFSSDPWSGFAAIRKFFAFAALVLAYNAYQNKRQIERTLLGVVLAGSLSALYGLGQFVYDYWHLTRQGLPFYENYVAHQITGFMSHWMTLGGQLMMILLLALAFLLFGGLPRKHRRLGWLCVAVLTLTLLAAFTRGIWLGTIVSAGYLLVRSERRRLLWLLPVGLLLLFLASPSWLQRRGFSILQASNDSSIQSRLVMIPTGWRMIAAHPWFGIGPEQVGPQFLRYKPEDLPLPEAWYGHLHSNYLQLAAERGIPCLLIWLWMLFEVAYAGISTVRSSSSNGRAGGHLAVAVTLGLMVSGLFEFNFGDSEVLILYLFLIATPYSWTRLTTESLSGSPASPEISPTRAVPSEAL